MIIVSISVGDNISIAVGKPGLPGFQLSLVTQMIQLNFDYLCLSDIKTGAITGSFHVGVSKQGYPKKSAFLKICEIKNNLRE